ncbi:CG1575 [Drosophila busckii]|uniref:CG1575 n=1 Tax=Drosophila busckii TaxID=30019 RepID=A0A0M5J5Y3_DROBS|nr:testis-expressed protein 10 [Drosophila busckii]ALC48656.1 CG1575 [Drosophila busckii]
MGGQHKKHLRAEKAKVKLKGAKLPKGLNVTKTDFKVRKIEIREQLRDTALFAGSGAQRQLNLKETLSRLKHHNSKFRLDALHQIRDAVKSGQAQQLIGQLNELLQGVTSGALDIEREVRQQSCKTLDVLLEALEADAISPFFHIITAYLRCAMTHVQPAIQEDSLALMDVLLLRVPGQLLAERSASSMISHFIDMISRLRHDTRNSNRLLTVRLGQGQQTTIKWRTKVLLRLQQIFQTLLQRENSKGAAKPRVVHFEQETEQYYNVLRPLQLDRRNTHIILHEGMRPTEQLQLQNYVEQLMPLLQDSWLEVRPEQQQQKDKEKQQQQLQQQQILLDGDAAASLMVVLDIMQQLWQLVLQQPGQQEQQQLLSTWLRKNYADNFLRYFLRESSFPYEQTPTTLSKKRKGKANANANANDNQCLAQNLTLVHLLCHFWPQPKQALSEDFAALLHYMLRCLRQLRTINPPEQLRLVAALRALLLDNGAALLALQPLQMGLLLSQCIDAYVEQQYTTREGVATRVLHLLCELVQQPQLYQEYGGADQFGFFLKYLPQLLLKPSVSDATLAAMFTLSRQGNVVFLTALAECVAPVLQNLQHLQLTGDTSQAEAQFELQKRILNLFYYAKHAAGQQKLLEQALQECQLQASEQVFNYFKSVLSFD